MKEKSQPIPVLVWTRFSSGTLLEVWDQGKERKSYLYSTLPRTLHVGLMAPRLLTNGWKFIQKFLWDGFHHAILQKISF